MHRLTEFYGTSVPNISVNIRNILEENELRAEATIKEYLMVRRESSRQVERPVKHCNLCMPIDVGSRGRSPPGNQFRQWASRLLSYCFPPDWEKRY